MWWPSSPPPIIATVAAIRYYVFLRTKCNLYDFSLGILTNCILCRPRLWNWTTPWSTRSSSSTQPQGSYTFMNSNQDQPWSWSSFIFRELKNQVWSSQLQERRATRDAPHPRLLPLNSNWLQSLISAPTTICQHFSKVGQEFWKSSGTWSPVCRRKAQYSHTHNISDIILS